MIALWCIVSVLGLAVIWQYVIGFRLYRYLRECNHMIETIMDSLDKKAEKENGMEGK